MKRKRFPKSDGLIFFMSDLHCSLCCVYDLRTGGKKFGQDNLCKFLNLVFPSVKTCGKKMCETEISSRNSEKKQLTSDLEN